MSSENEKLWYIVQTYSGKENSVKDNLEQRITSLNMENLIFRVLVPEKTVLEEKEETQEQIDEETGEKVKVKVKVQKEKVVKVFPGYVFVEMIDNTESWWVVRNTPQVTGFLGSSGKKTRPVPVRKEEMTKILESCGIFEEIKGNFNVGDFVNIVDGSYKGFSGVIEDIDKEDKTAFINIEFMGRPMTVPVGLNEIEEEK